MTSVQREPKIPPDPEGMNDARAEWANAAIDAFIAANNTDHEDALSDLLADLMHWGDRDGADFNAELRRARMHYEYETDGKGAASTSAKVVCVVEGGCLNSVYSEDTRLDIVLFDHDNLRLTGRSAKTIKQREAKATKGLTEVWSR